MIINKMVAANEVIGRNEDEKTQLFLSSLSIFMGRGEKVVPKAGNRIENVIREPEIESERLKKEQEG